MGIIEVILGGALLLGLALALLALLARNQRNPLLAMAILVFPVLLAVGLVMLAAFRAPVFHGTQVSETVRVFPQVPAPPRKSPRPVEIPIESAIQPTKSPPPAASQRMTVILQPADAKGQSDGNSSVSLDIRADGDKQSQAAGLLRALANALVKVASETPSAETAINVAAKVIPTPTPDPAPTPQPPDWIEAPPKLVDGVYQVPIIVGPFESRMKCDRELPEALRQAVDAYVDQYLVPEAVGRVTLPKEYLQSHLVRETWTENRSVAVTSTDRVPMVLLHVLLGFDTDVNNRLSEMWHRVVIFQRLHLVGLVVAGVLVVLATFWAYLRVDLATAGAYRNRLRVAAVLVLALLVVLATRLA